jgi:asparagine synthase (glutamine-hydrolysing)
MSGICGIIHWDTRPVKSSELQTMAEAAAHRGPDGIHYRTCGQAGFAHLALHVTPESVRERQPLASPDGQILLVADARIDNREDLIQFFVEKQLLAGIEATDPEIILAAYRLWGTECAAHLLGDFAFAIWDASQQHLFAARDPMAMRAFYYRFEPQRFLFGTEVKQILAAPEVPAKIFEPAAAAHLAGCFHHLDWTFYEGIAQLPPAHALLAGAKGSRTWRYWDIDPEYRINYKDERQYVEHFLEIFRDAVRRRVRSVRPVGILLSGGVDSGSVASLAGSLLKQERLCPEFRAYSWAFETLRQCDERHISDGIVEHYGFPVTYIDAESHGPLSGYPAHGPDRDEPYIGAYQALLEQSMARARDESMRVVLSGDRGDLVAGEYIYDYPGLFWSGPWATLVKELRLQAQWRKTSLAGAAWKHLIGPWPQIVWPPAKAARLRQKLARANRRLRGNKPSYPAWIRPEFARRVGLDEIVQADPSPLHLSGLARRQRHAVIFVPMHLRGMVWSERTQARFGLGFADAWSDRRLAQFAVAVPQRALNRTGEDKRLVRSAMAGIMPEEVRLAVRKIVPQPLYIKALTETAKTTVSNLLLRSRSDRLGYVDETELRKHHETIRETGRDHAGFWWALTLEMWLRQYWP